MNTNRLLTYALNAEKKLVYINDVSNGLECNCICPECEQPLIAKNAGNIREHHFAHKGDAECLSGYQTMIHLLAKEIIIENKILHFFPIAGKPIVARQIASEVHLSDLNIIPDVFAVASLTITYGNFASVIRDIPFIIEVFVTHKVDENKAGIIKNAGIPAVEIDLSKSEANTKEELIKDIYNPVHWNYINETIGQNFIPQIKLLNRYNPYPSSYGSGYPKRYKNSGRRLYYRKRR